MEMREEHILRTMCHTHRGNHNVCRDIRRDRAASNCRNHRVQYCKWRECIPGCFLLLMLASQVTICSAVPQGCNSTIDLAFLIDTSESLRDYDPPDQPLFTWNLLKDFAKRVVQNLPVSSTETKVAAVRFSSQADLAFNFDRYQTSINVQDGIKKMEHAGGNTNTADALSKARGTFRNLGRTQSRKVIVLITDGLSNVMQDRTLEEARRAKENENIEIFSVGITKYINEDELLMIASEPKDTHYLQAETFADLDEIWEKLVHRICDLPDPVPTTNPPPIPDECKVEGCIDCLTEYTCVTCQPGRYYHPRQAKCLPCMEFCEICRSFDTCDRCNIGWYWEPLLSTCSECEVQADISFVIDTSGSIRDKNPEDESYDNYQILKDFVKSLIDRLDIGPDTTRVGAIRYSTAATLEMNLDQYQARQDIKDQIDAMQYGGGHTNTSGGLRMMRQQMFVEERGDRPDVRNVGIVITDGESTKDKEFTIPEAMRCKQDNITLFVVGVTDEINEAELKGIASDPDEEHYFNQTEIKLLDTIILQLIKHVCAPDNPAARPVSQSGQTSNTRNRRDTSKSSSHRTSQQGMTIILFISLQIFINMFMSEFETLPVHVNL